MTIDWNKAVVNLLNRGKFPNRIQVKSKLQWIDNRLVVSLHGFHGYCEYSRKTPNDQTDLEHIENCMIEIIDAATFVLKTTRQLKITRMEKQE